MSAPFENSLQQRQHFTTRGLSLALELNYRMSELPFSTMLTLQLAYSPLEFLQIAFLDGAVHVEDQLIMNLLRPRHSLQIVLDVRTLATYCLV